MQRHTAYPKRGSSNTKDRGYHMQTTEFPSKLIFAGNLSYLILSATPYKAANPHAYADSLCVDPREFFAASKIDGPATPFCTLTSTHMCCRNTANYLVPALLSLSPQKNGGHQALSKPNTTYLGRRASVPQDTKPQNIVPASTKWWHVL
jgi:hypothetical protein